MSRQDFIIKIHLIISVLIVVPVAFIYGFKPSVEFDIYLGTTDEQNFFKAVMGLYIGFSILWIFGIFQAKHLKTALISNVIFMFSLASGRILSLLIDGMPSKIYVFGVVGELIFGFYGLWVLNSKYPKKS